MKPLEFPTSFLSSSDLEDLIYLQTLIRRKQILPAILKMHIEDYIICNIDLDDQVLEDRRNSFLGNTPYDEFLSQRNWLDSDFIHFISRDEALRVFAESRFGPGLEEYFLSSGGSLDQVIYSVLRNRDFGVVQEMWIRLEEESVSFAELACEYGQGPESVRKGLIGPQNMGDVAPVELATILRGLQVGQVSNPITIGEWHLLLRLEQLQPACFDEKMKSTLLRAQLDNFLEEQVQHMLQGNPLSEFDFSGIR